MRIANLTNGRAIPDYQIGAGKRQRACATSGARARSRTSSRSTFWESLDAIRAFAGEDVEKAKYYPEDTGFLLEFETLFLRQSAKASTPYESFTGDDAELAKLYPVGTGMQT